MVTADDLNKQFRTLAKACRFKKQDVGILLFAGAWPREVQAVIESGECDLEQSGFHAICRTRSSTLLGGSRAVVGEVQAGEHTLKVYAGTYADLPQTGRTMRVPTTVGVKDSLVAQGLMSENDACDEMGYPC